jgi:hypothetical protein
MEIMYEPKESLQMDRKIQRKVKGHCCCHTFGYPSTVKRLEVKENTVA